MPDQITLYSADICPWAQRTRIALKEVNADYTEYKIDLQNKPEWYAPKINPASKVPADQPSPESVKIPESAITVEFIADLFPNTILPADPVQRAQIRYFVDTFVSKVIAPYHSFVSQGEKSDELLKGIETVQDLIPAPGPFFLGDKYSAAEILIAPFLGRFKILVESDIGGFETAEGKRVLNTLTQDAKFAKFAKYWEAVVSRPSVKETLPVDLIKEYAQKRFGANKKSTN
ncbi:hypothetical protein EXIGLDRAFT_45372 [Exidia glandulosa HHB12029]|uniref:Glutathione S-transferase n=1 Tax=Exidia glandulosa HHB12029 TaxID=1314781 RepID=A0A165II81_EXIGL|nr:hypothetical protein EXIGLDRAFT_45372 [Exidia glandulosa HHB12029]